MDNTFTKAERLCSKTIIDKLFAGGNSSMSAFPLRIVFMKTERNDKAPVSVLISVPKKRFHHAVDRNRVKRLVRETYRTNKHQLSEYVAKQQYSIAIAFVCITENMPSHHIVLKSMQKSLTRILERLQAE